jgi:hypothetical protein
VDIIGRWILVIKQHPSRSTAAAQSCGSQTKQAGVLSPWRASGQCGAIVRRSYAGTLFARRRVLSPVPPSPSLVAVGQCPARSWSSRSILKAWSALRKNEQEEWRVSERTNRRRRTITSRESVRQRRTNPSVLLLACRGAPGCKGDEWNVGRERTRSEGAHRASFYHLFIHLFIHPSIHHPQQETRGDPQQSRREEEEEQPGASRYPLGSIADRP